MEHPPSWSVYFFRITIVSAHIPNQTVFHGSCRRISLRTSRSYEIELIVSLKASHGFSTAHVVGSGRETSRSLCPVQNFPRRIRHQPETPYCSRNELLPQLRKKRAESLRRQRFQYSLGRRFLISSFWRSSGFRSICFVLMVDFGSSFGPPPPLFKH